MTEKVTVITGASSGIGEALARQLGANGHRLVLGARRENELNRVGHEIGPDAVRVITDGTRRKEVDHLRDIALQRYGHVDIWVNNAGRGITKSVMELTDKEFDEIVAVVLKSVFYGMQTIVPHFQERGEGHLINVSSFLGRVPLIPYRSIYSAMKSAVNVLTANLRVDLKAKYPGIHVSTVMLGVVNTDFQSVAGSAFTVRAGTTLCPQRVQSADEVAVQIVSLIDHPVAELYTNPAAPELAQQYFRDVALFDESMLRRRSSGN